MVVADKHWVAAGVLVCVWRWKGEGARGVGEVAGARKMRKERVRKERVRQERVRQDEVAGARDKNEAGAIGWELGGKNEGVRARWYERLHMSKEAGAMDKVTRQEQRKNKARATYHVRGCSCHASGQGRRWFQRR